MKQKIKYALRDCAAALLLLVLFRPFGIGGNKNKFVAIIGVTVLVFISSLLTTLLAMVFMKSDSSPSYESEQKRQNFEFILNVPILAFLLITYLGWYVYDDICAGWIMDGTFVLWPYLSAVVCVILVSIPIYIWSRDQLKKRFMKAEIEELQTLNTMLEKEQQALRSQLPKDNAVDKIILQSDSRDSLIINPLDILYLESIGNYLNIVYYSDSELCQKRLRSTLKDVEETLNHMPFMVHTHRAFLVNINYISQISGNSAGYKISMFGTDRILPVSKANVAIFKEKLNILGKQFG